jgi:hypothetical protein
VIVLYKNCIGVKGVEYFAEAIKHNCTLQVFDIGGNNIGAEGARYLADAIKVNSALQVVNLGGHQRADRASQIDEKLMDNILRQKMNYRKFICAFTEVQTNSSSSRLIFDKMILRFLYYPIMGILPRHEF